jgi:hypothetical protein
MAKMFVKQKVADIARWQRVFGEMETARQRYGLHLTGMYRAIEPRTIIVTLDADDLSKEKAFAESDILRESRERAGAEGEADYWIAESSLD